MQFRLTLLACTACLVLACDGPEEESLRGDVMGADQDAVAQTPAPSGTSDEAGMQTDDESSTDGPVVEPEVIIVENVITQEVEEVTKIYTAPDRTGEETVTTDNADAPVMMQSANQLQNSIATCIGPGLTEIRAESIIDIGGASSGDAFLLPIPRYIDVFHAYMRRVGVEY